MLAHELRNPLAPIVMAAALLGKMATVHPMLPKLHGIISRQVGHMAHLVDDLLDASRVTTGNIPCIGEQAGCACMCLGERMQWIAAPSTAIFLAGLFEP